MAENEGTLLVQLAQWHAGSWPWVTFAVNLVGCFLLGYFVTRLQETRECGARGRSSTK